MIDPAKDQEEGSELTPERWRQLDALLDRALGLDAEDRQRFLDRLEGDEAELRDELTELLEHSARPSEDLGPSGRVVARLAEELRRPHDDLSGRRLGPYRLLRLVGRGGGGSVYRAERADRQFEMEVAVKVVADSLQGAELRARFLAERQILARLDHPGIARLLDGGISDDGIPYLVMEFVDGLPIDEHCERHGLGVRDILGLLLQICDAVAHAHRNLVVHRDLKPANVMVTAEGAVKVLDFGIAKELTEDAGLTRTGSRWMTPEYAAPEQVRAEAVTTATDVYSLGVLLYRLLTGTSPYGDTSSRFDTERAILDTEPGPPSAALHERRRRRALRGDLDAIVLKALRKEPQHRYAGVEALAEEIRRHLDGLPVAARRGARWYRAGKFIRRHRLGVAATALVLLLLVGWTITTQRQSQRIAEERDRAERVAAILPELFWGLEPGELGTRAVSPREMLDRGMRRVEESLAGEPEIRATIFTLACDVYMRMDEHRRGEELARRAYEIRRELYGERSVETAESLAMLAQAIDHQGRAEESEPLHRRALETRRVRLSPDHPDLAVSLHNFAMVQEDLGHYETAEAMYREALDIRRGALGDHRDTAYTLTNLAIVLFYDEHYDESHRLATEALEMRRRILQEHHADFAHSYNILGALARATGDLETALAMNRQMLEVYESSHGPDHSSVAYALLALGHVFLELRRYGEAVASYRRSHDIFVASGNEPLAAALSDQYLGMALLQFGESDEGEERALRSYQDLRRIAGDGHRLTQEALERLRSVGLAKPDPPEPD